MSVRAMPKPDTANRKSASARDTQQGGHSLARLLFDALRLPPSIILASMLINLLGLALPLVILQIFDRVLRNESVNTLTLLIAGLFGVILVETILRLSRNALLIRSSMREGFARHMRAQDRLLRAPRTHTSRHTPESLFDALAATDDINGFFGGNGRLALLDAPFVLLFLGFIWLIGGWLAAIPAALIVIFIGWAIWSSRGLKQALEAQLEGERQRFAFYGEILSGITTVKSLAVEPQMERRLERILNAGSPANYRFVLQANRMIAAGQLFASAVMISIVTFGGYFAIEGSLTLGAVAACTLLANRVTQPVLRIIGVWSQMEAARLARDRAHQVFGLPEQPAAAKANGPAHIGLSELAMRDPEASVSPTGLCLSLPSGSVTGFACSSFVERTQFQDILRGRLAPDQGAVTVNGIDLATPEGAALADQIYFIGGEPVVLRGTILENIAMFRSGVGQINAVSAARKLGIDGLIQALPDGYDTRLGDHGDAGLSRELLRAIDIARAVTVRPPVLIIAHFRGKDGDVGASAAARAIDELRGRTTIVLIGEHPADLIPAKTIYALRAWRFRRVDTVDAAPADGISSPSLMKRLAQEGV
jgi:ATP-binding cassette subfamily C protein LapB